MKLHIKKTRAGKVRVKLCQVRGDTWEYSSPEKEFDRRLIVGAIEKDDWIGVAAIRGVVTTRSGMMSS